MQAGKLISFYTNRGMLIFVLFILLCTSCGKKASHLSYYYPADFDPVKTTYLIYTDAFYGIIPKISTLISEKDSVTMVLDRSTGNTSDVMAELEKYNANPEHIGFLRLGLNIDNYWIRDFGPAYVKDKAGNMQSVVFQYFGVHNQFMDAFGMQRSDLALKSSELNGSGGAREVNGKGTMILCEAHEMDVNPGKSLKEIEKEMIRVFHLKKIIWLKKGIPQDDSFLDGPLVQNIYPVGVNGHIDEFCRFVNPNTIMLASVSESEARQHPILAMAKKRMDENLEILLQSRDQDGNAFTIIQVPVAPLIINRKNLRGMGEQLVATVTSYMNFIVTNHRVIMPSYVNYDSPQTALVNREKYVENLFRKAFPDREIVRVRADTLNYYSGGFHCLSINEPK